ncbi:MAG TPA: ABC transporter ATP-binding protein [Tepidisphaeraceae bacterium]|nr:ABC transporter ATP-binding protein [Tepidisphaeraceae bacterium]
MDNGQQILLSIEQARVQFDQLVAVRDVSLELHGGDLLGLIGPNGAGKTTLLRAAAGLQPLTSGTIKVLGMPAGPNHREPLRYIGFTPDTPPVYEEMTVRQFLRFIALGYDLGMGQVDERIDFWLEKVWLAEKANHKIKALSRGMRQRIGIARTLLPNPMVIFLDEPAAGLDPAGRVQFRQLLCDLREQGKALVVSSHILADMDEYCSHIAIMAHGAIMQFGTVAEVASAASGTRCRYTLLLAKPVAGLRDLLAKIPGVQEVQLDRERITLEFYSDREEAANLLSHLIHQQIPIASFSPNAIGLEEAYLRTGITQVD